MNITANWICGHRIFEKNEGNEFIFDKMDIIVLQWLYTVTLTGGW